MNINIGKMWKQGRLIKKRNKTMHTHTIICKQNNEMHKKCIIKYVCGNVTI
jgi:hypothetical protein